MTARSPQELRGLARSLRANGLVSPEIADFFDDLADSSGFAFYATMPLTFSAVTTEQAAADSWEVTLGSAFFPEPTVFAPFVAFYEGFVYIDLKQAATYHFCLVVTHEITGPDGRKLIFDTQRLYTQRVGGSELYSLALAVFDSDTVLEPGPYTPEGGTAFDIGKPMLDAGAKITLKLNVTRDGDSKLILESASMDRGRAAFWQHYHTHP